MPSPSPIPGPPPPPGGALATFLATALVLVTALALLLRFRPELFAPRTAAPPAPTLAPRLPEPTGALARYAARPVSEPARPSPEEALAVTLFEDARRSVCLVSNLARDPGTVQQVTAGEHVQGTGSGVVWDSLGHIVTNYHVVAGAQAATVTLPDGQAREAWLVGYDERFDLAVMRIDPRDVALVPLRMGRSSDLRVGQRVYSIGFPYGLGHTLSSGIVSGLDRAVRTPAGLVLEGTVQTDADIHPGSSGGPLLDAGGRLVGLCLATHGEARHGAGVAFALPIDLVHSVVPTIMRSGLEWLPELGLVLASDDKSTELIALLRREGAAGGAEWLQVVPERGVVVAIVQAGTPAARADLRGMQQRRRPDGGSELIVRDIVVAVDGVRLSGRDSLDEVLHGALRGAPAGGGAGRTVRLEVVGAAGARTVDLVAE